MKHKGGQSPEDAEAKIIDLLGNGPRAREDLRAISGLSGSALSRKIQALKDAGILVEISGGYALAAPKPDRSQREPRGHESPIKTVILEPMEVIRGWLKAVSGSVAQLQVRNSHFSVSHLVLVEVPEDIEAKLMQLTGSRVILSNIEGKIRAGAASSLEMVSNA